MPALVYDIEKEDCPRGAPVIISKRTTDAQKASEKKEAEKYDESDVDVNANKAGPGSLFKSIDEHAEKSHKVRSD